MNKQSTQTKRNRSYTESTKKRLFALSGNECAFPGCQEKLVDEDTAVKSCICHIEGLSPNGARYNADMTNEECNDYRNLILLCKKHHDMIDADENTYTVKVLKEMKHKHEVLYIHKKIQCDPGMLRKIIEAIAEIKEEDIGSTPVPNEYDISEKMTFNALKDGAMFIQEYKAYHGRLTKIYNEMDEQGAVCREGFMKVIRHIYIATKVQYLKDTANEMDVIRQHSDDILLDIHRSLCDSIDIDDEIHCYLEPCVWILMVDAFIRCKILEAPRDITYAS